MLLLLFASLSSMLTLPLPHYCLLGCQQVVNKLHIRLLGIRLTHTWNNTQQTYTTVNDSSALLISAPSERVCSGLRLTFPGVPCVPLRPRLHLHCPRLANVDITCRRLLVEPVQLQQLLVVGLLVESLDALSGGLEISL